MERIADIVIALVYRSLDQILSDRDRQFLLSGSNVSRLSVALRAESKAVISDWLDNAEERARAIVSDRTLEQALATDCLVAAQNAVFTVKASHKTTEPCMIVIARDPSATDEFCWFKISSNGDVDVLDIAHHDDITPDELFSTLNNSDLRDHTECQVWMSDNMNDCHVFTLS